MTKKFKFERLNPQTNILPSISHAIGETPLVDLTRLVKHYGADGRILAKCEYLNPGFSKKDRPALQMLIEARETGDLKEGQIVEQGTHDGLLAQGGIYREIYDLQLQPQEEMLLDAPINNPVDQSSAGDTPGGGSPRLATDTGGDN
jgi:hypothetical protein